MKNTTGKIGGFMLGTLLGFIAIAVASHLDPEEDFAGVTIAMLFIFGLFFAFVGSLAQSYIEKKGVN